MKAAKDAARKTRYITGGGGGGLLERELARGLKLRCSTCHYFCSLPVLWRASLFQAVALLCVGRFTRVVSPKTPSALHLISISSPSHFHLRHPRMVNANAGHHRPCRRPCPCPLHPRPPPPGRPPPQIILHGTSIWSTKPSRRGISTTCSAWRSPK